MWPRVHAAQGRVLGCRRAARSWPLWHHLDTIWAMPLTAVPAPAQPYPARLRMSAIWVGAHLPPRAVGTPHAFRALAISALTGWIRGRTLAATGRPQP